MNTIILKYPAGEFTQAELAAFNGMEKPAVYIPLREALGKGTIIKSGTRPTGKKPANLYKIADNNAPVPVPATLTAQPIPEAPPTQTIPSEVNPVPNPPDAVILAKALDTALQEHRPPVINRLAPNPAYPCPLCKGPMTEIPDATGVTVKCFNEPCDPQCHENVFGHSRTAKEAYEKAKEHFIMP
jgi:hypothetical protein